MRVTTTDLERARADAVKLLLARPLLDQARDPEAFRTVVIHRTWLEEWFETTCGWQLTVDLRDGLARLAKRSTRPDHTRPAIRPRRSRAARRPFDRRRYQLLCLVAADLVRRPATTIALLASELESVTAADPALDAFEPSERATERRAFVDALNLLVGWGAVATSGGDLGDFVDDPDANAIIEVDQSRLHHLLASARPPSTIAGELSPDDRIDPEVVVARLVSEPRYAAVAPAPRPDDPAGGPGTEVTGAAADELRNRWHRHAVARRLLDDPVVHLDDLSEGQRGYLTSQAGRQWLRARIGEAGLELEERAEGWAAIDPDTVATDRVFPGPGDNVKQAALLLLDRFVTVADDGSRSLSTRSRRDLETTMVELLERYRGWAAPARRDDGHLRLVADAVALLTEVGLVTLDGDDVVPRPMLARYSTVPPRTDALKVFRDDQEPV